MAEPLKFSVTQSPQMLALISDTSLCKRFAAVFPDLEKVMLQTMLDVTSEGNRDDVGPTILAMKNIYDIFFVIKTRGEAILETERKNDAKTK